MSREAWGDPPEAERKRCPFCDSDHYTIGCDHCDTVKEKCAVEVEVTRLRTRNEALVREAWTWSKACESATTKLHKLCAPHPRLRIEYWTGSFWDPMDGAKLGRLLETLDEAPQFSVGLAAVEAVSTEAVVAKINDEGRSNAAHWRAAHAEEARKFQAETLRSSHLATVLRKFATHHRIEYGHEPGPWSRTCILCSYVRQADALLVVEQRKETT